MEGANTKTEDGSKAQPFDQKPVTHLQKCLAIAWFQALGSMPGLDTNFFDAGGTSLDGMLISARAEELVGTEIPFALVVQYPTVRLLAEHLQGFSGNMRWTNLVEVRQEGAQVPIVVVHGDEANYHLSLLLPDGHPFLAFFHQSEDGTPMKHRSFVDIATHYAKELQEARPDGPLVICGYSYGGVIALELAQCLKEQGRDVPLLVLLDSRSPSVFRERTIKKYLMRVRDIRDRMHCNRLFAQGLPLPLDLRNFYIMDVYGKAMRKHRPISWHGPSLLIRSEARNVRAHGWGDLLTDLRTVVVPGDHRSIITAKGLVPVVAAVREALAQSAP